MGAGSRVGGDGGAAHCVGGGGGGRAGVSLAVAGWALGPLGGEGGAACVSVLNTLSFL